MDGWVLLLLVVVVVVVLEWRCAGEGVGFDGSVQVVRAGWDQLGKDWVGYY
jgi:hypothetical protein